MPFRFGGRATGRRACEARSRCALTHLQACKGTARRKMSCCCRWCTRPTPAAAPSSSSVPPPTELVHAACLRPERSLHSRAPPRAASAEAAPLRVPRPFPAVSRPPTDRSPRRRPRGSEGAGLRLLIVHASRGRLRRDWARPCPHLQRDCARRCHSWAHPHPQLLRDWARPTLSCSGTGLAPPSAAPGLRSPHPHLQRDCARPTLS
jgi:hypothetical protein